jgi:hypothetical protein
MTNHLVAEIRPDRNGKLVTRHVKTGSAPSPSLKSLPVPAITAPSADSQRADLINAFAAVNSNPLAQKDFADCVTNVTEVSVQVMHDALKEHGDALYIKRIIFHASTEFELRMMCFNLDVMKAIEATEKANGASKAEQIPFNIFRQLLTDNFKLRKLDDGFDFKKVSPAFRSAVLSEILGCDDKSLSTFETMEQMETLRSNGPLILSNFSGLVRVSRTTYDYGSRPNAEEAVELASLLEQYPGTEELVCSVVTSRKRLDLGEIRQVLESGAPSLASGLL